MFDIGFSEILVIGVVALIVIGPERLPKTARMLGHLFGRLQRYVGEVKADISREMELDELRRLQREVKGVASELQQSMTSVAREVEASVRSVESGVRNVERDLNDAARGELPYTPPDDPSNPAADPAGVHTPPPADSRQASLPGLEKI